MDSRPGLPRPRPNDRRHPLDLYELRDQLRGGPVEDPALSWGDRLAYGLLALALLIGLGLALWPDVLVPWLLR